ncbi:phage baseplate assembly protein V [Neisseriaceae bacterium TC5R-5]|nr:phage baseplate assembly protein V [Neisseriaceae bacterium TC5R-5]
MNHETLDEFGATIKYGTVSASRPGFARVRLPDFDNMRTMWLPMVFPKTQADQCCWTYDNGEQVAVLLDARGEDGVILGAVYSSADTPPISDPNKFSIRFKDGALLEYDRGSQVLTVSGVAKVLVAASADIVLKAGGKVIIDAPDTEATGNLLVNGKLTYKGGMAGSGGAGASAAITGNIAVEGNIKATGSVMDAGGNSNHHSH